MANSFSEARNQTLFVAQVITPSWPDWLGQALAPPFAPLAPLLEQLPKDRWPDPCDWTNLSTQLKLHNTLHCPLTFIPASTEKLPALAFEQRIFDHGEVETREQNWHDAFHALAWQLFPNTKARINARHVADGAAQAPNGRSPLRNLLTLFDESGIVIASADPLLTDLLRRFQWHELFWTRRAAVQRAMDFVIFGHALYEQAHHLFDGVTGKGVVVPVPPEYFAWEVAQRLLFLDTAVEKFFAAATTDTGPHALQPLPLKGIPGWAAENETEAYYRDERQFRPGRTRQAPAA